MTPCSYFNISVYVYLVRIIILNLNVFPLSLQLVFGKKIFYVFKIDKTVRKTEINVDAQYKDPDIAKLKKEEKVHSWIHYCFSCLKKPISKIYDILRCFIINHMYEPCYVQADCSNFLFLFSNIRTTLCSRTKIPTFFCSNWPRRV